MARTGFQIHRASSVETLSDHLVRVFDGLAINCVLDIGAHHGHFGKRLRRNGYRGTIVSFEPVADNFRALMLAARGDHLWRVFKFALGDQSGFADINVFGFSTLHSLLAASDYGRQNFGADLSVARTERIEIRRLDETLGACLEGLSSPRLFMKIDTQGFDLAVIEGAGAALDKMLALQTEVALKPIYADMQTTLCNVIPRLQARGFGVSGLFPVSRNKTDGLQIIELDCVMTRNIAA